MNNPYGTEFAPLDLIAIARWNHEVRKSVDAYEASKPGAQFEDIDYAARIKASEKQVRFRARRKAAAK